MTEESSKDGQKELLKKLKLSLRLDMDEDDDLLQLYLDTATAYIQGAVGDETSKFWQLESVKALFRTALIAQATGYYTARTSLSNIPMSPVNMSVNSIVGQLRGRYATYLERMEG
ncbi:head-tail connector protein [Weissella viridescens]|uniref:head-tail connector protein n=1 Tax=Weissella viridescens TaxID=1629 RepID=UPI004055E28A